jgi:hypothetical protein
MAGAATEPDVAERYVAERPGNEPEAIKPEAIEPDGIEREAAASIAPEATVDEAAAAEAPPIRRTTQPFRPPMNQRPAGPRPAAGARAPFVNGQPSLPARAAGMPAEADEAQAERTATAPQLRRFIKSRAYVPMHELRRRFGIVGDDDEVTPVDVERTRVFVGLPEREGRLLGELLRGGDIGYELSLDPITPIVVGVYPMRPVTRG